jgi:hypothetical protein
MATYTTLIAGRNPDKFELKSEEASDMLAAGFKFAEFNSEQGRFRISVPCRIAHNLTRDTLTIEQK